MIAIIQIADRIIGCCKFYIETARDAPSDLRIILRETSALKIVLENFKFLSDCDGRLSAAKGRMFGADGPIKGCRRTVAELEKLSLGDASRTTQGKSSRRKLNSY